MIYRHHKIRNLIRQLADENSRQAGVTLLLALLVLSAILSIAFSITTILFIEVRSSNDLIKTEPAIYGANAIGEEAIFNIKRHTCDAGNCAYTTQFNNKVIASAPVKTSTTTPIFQDRIPAGGSFNTANTYVFYNAIAGTSSTTGSSYGKVSISYLDTGNLGGNNLIIYLCEFNPSLPVDPTGQTVFSYHSVACSDPADSSHLQAPGNLPYWIQTAYSLTPTASVNFNLDPAKQQTLLLYNPNSVNIYVKIQTFDADGVTPKGLPYVGQTAVDINVSNAAVGRKVRVTVPNSSN